MLLQCYYCQLISNIRGQSRPVKAYQFFYCEFWLHSSILDTSRFSKFANCSILTSANFNFFKYRCQPKSCISEMKLQFTQSIASCHITMIEYQPTRIDRKEAKSSSRLKPATLRSTSATWCCTGQATIFALFFRLFQHSGTVAEWLSSIEALKCMPLHGWVWPNQNPVPWTHPNNNAPQLGLQHADSLPAWLILTLVILQISQSSFRPIVVSANRRSAPFLAPSFWRRDDLSRSRAPAFPSSQIFTTHKNDLILSDFFSSNSTSQTKNGKW